MKGGTQCVKTNTRTSALVSRCIAVIQVKYQRCSCFSLSLKQETVQRNFDSLSFSFSCSPGLSRERSPGLPRLLALSFLSWAVGIRLELISKQHAVVSRVLQKVPQTVGVPAQNQRLSLLQNPSNQSDRNCPSNQSDSLVQTNTK